MAVYEHPTSEADLVALLLTRNGNETLVTTVDGEPMRVREVEKTDLPSAIEWDYFAKLGGIGLSANDGKYSFFSTEVATIRDIASGAVLYVRRAA